MSAIAIPVGYVGFIRRWVTAVIAAILVTVIVAGLVIGVSYEMRRLRAKRGGWQTTTTTFET